MDWLPQTLEALNEMIQINAGMVVIIVLFTLTVLMNWAAIVLLINQKTMERRKQLSMDRVDEVSRDLEQYIRSKYLSLAKRQLGDDYFNEMETRLVNYNIREALDIILDEYRRRVRKNGFENKSPSAWSQYVESCIEEDLNTFTRTVDLNYHPGSKITRPMWFAYNQDEVVPEAVHRMKHLFNDLLNIAENHRFKRFLFWKLQL